MPRHRNAGGQIYVDPGPSEKVISDPVKILQAHTLPNANRASDYQHGPKCHPQTRTAVLNVLDEWARQCDTPTPVKWLFGPAGAGKTAIANTLRERWSEQHSLAANVSVSPTMRTDVVQESLAATIASQLMSNIPATSDQIGQAISKDAGIFKSSFENQLQSLVFSPLHAAREAGVLQNPAVLVIDGLYDCSAAPESPHPYNRILETILSVFPLQSPLRCLIVSRDANPVGAGAKNSRSSLVEYIALDSFNNEEDIEVFLKSSLEGVMGQIPAPLADKLILSLTKNAGGLFVYAGTAALFLGNPNTDLKRDFQALSSNTARGSTPIARLDALYTHILNSCPSKSLSLIRSVLEGLCLSTGFESRDAYQRIFSGIRGNSPRFFEKLLNLPEGHIMKHLGALHAVLQLPSPKRTHDIPIQFFHISFQQYLLDQSRAGQFFICRIQALLNFQMYMIKHTLIILSETPAKIDYDEKVVVRLMLSGFADPQCPPSKELRDGLNALMEADEQRYYDYVSSIGLENLGRGRRIKFSELITPMEELTVLRYLQKCSIPEIEGSWWRRWMTSIYLAPQITLLGTAFR